MGREIVYCWKCATRLQGSDFESGQAYRVGDKVSCPPCVDELIADLSAEEQEAILSPQNQTKPPTQPIRKISTTQLRAAPPPERQTGVRRAPTGPVPKVKTGTTGVVPRVRTGTTGPVPAADAPKGGTRVTRKVTRPVPKVEAPPEETPEGEEGDGGKPPMDEKKKKLLILGGVGGGLALLIVVLLIIVLTRKPAPKKPLAEEAAEAAAKTAAAPAEAPKEKAAKTAIKEFFDLQRAQPEALGAQYLKLREAEKAAEGTSLAVDVEKLSEDLRAAVDKAVAAVDKQIEAPYANGEFKTVIDAYEKAKGTHDIPEWKSRIETKLKLVVNKVDYEYGSAIKKAREHREAGEEAEIVKLREGIAKWAMPDYAEKFDKALEGIAKPDGSPDSPVPAIPGAPGKPAPAARKPLSAEMQAFLPEWQKAMGLAISRDFTAAAGAMNEAGSKASSDEAKKAAAEDAETLKQLRELYPELLKSAGTAPRLTAVTLEYQDTPGIWKKVAGKVVKAEATRLEFRPEIDGKELTPILIELTDLAGGSLGELHKAKKKKLDKKEADLLTRLALIDGQPESAQALAGAAPDRYWFGAADTRAQAPRPNPREFEARMLFHQSELEWRKMSSWAGAIEKSKLLLVDYTSTLIVKKYQPLIAKRAETGKEYVFLPNDLKATGDYNTYKLIKGGDPAWIASKQIDFKDSLFNFIEAEFVALPNVQYRAYAYVGGCCQEVFNGSYQVTEGQFSNKGKLVAIDPGVQMAAPLPMPPGLKKTHADHKAKADKEHPKTTAKWDWISIPMPKTFPTSGAKQIRILTDQPAFGVKYVVVTSTRPKPPDEAYAKELAAAAIAPPPPSDKAEIKGAPTAKEWLVIGPFPEALGAENGPEKEIDLGKELKGKSGGVKWRPYSAVIAGANVQLDWEKGPFNPKDNVSAYALIHVKVPAAVNGKLILSHDDGGRVWVNGTLVHNNDRGGGMKPDEFQPAIKLEEGWNRILIKVRNGNAGFGAMFRITDGSKAPIPGIEFSPYGDTLEPM